MFTKKPAGGPQRGVKSPFVHATRLKAYLSLNFVYVQWFLTRVACAYRIWLQKWCSWSQMRAHSKYDKCHAEPESRKPGTHSFMWMREVGGGWRHRMTWTPYARLPASMQSAQERTTCCQQENPTRFLTFAVDIFFSLPTWDSDRLRDKSNDGNGSKLISNRK